MTCALFWRPEGLNLKFEVITLLTCLYMAFNGKATEVGGYLTAVQSVCLQPRQWRSNKRVYSEHRLCN